jgi:GrpB-like predicted nucleotidyltransferase (UPF0157 family)
VETLEERIKRVLQERVEIVPHDPGWPQLFEEEKIHLLDCLPKELLGRIEHFGSTAIPNMPAKPVVDMLAEVTSLEATKTRIAPVLEAQGYDYFWRATRGEDVPPFYAWFIKRDPTGNRTHHIHMVESHFDHWDALLFRDYLIEHPEVAKEYLDLKMRLALDCPNDREAYTGGKTDFVMRVTRAAKEYYKRT